MKPSKRSTRLALFAEHLRDGRGRRVIFVSHCLLNENVRYPGGAFRPGCVAEVLEHCIDAELGIVQLPCPEQRVWGGVRKRHLLALYGTHPPATFLKVALRYVRRQYRKLAREAAEQIDDYARSGFQVVGVIGIDGSPSCGVNETVDAAAFIREAGAIEPATFSCDAHNELVFRHLVEGRGLFVEALAAQLAARGLEVPLLAHSLRREAAGLPSEAFDAGASGEAHR